MASADTTPPDMTPAEEAPIVVVISGPSGAGKDTVLHLALSLDDSLTTVATAKTRAPRRGEQDGVHHVFLSEQEFDRWLAKDAFLEHATVYGHRSGVPRRAVEEQLAAGKSVILRTDIQGARSLRERLPGCLLVFVTVRDRAELRRRMQSRGTDSEPDMERRLAEAAAEMSESHWFDHVIVNETGGAEAAAESLLGYLQAARHNAASLPLPPAPPSSPSGPSPLPGGRLGGG